MKLFKSWLEYEHPASLLSKWACEWGLLYLFPGRLQTSQENRSVTLWAAVNAVKARRSTQWIGLCPWLMIKSKRQRKIVFSSWTFKKDAAWEPIDSISKFAPPWNWDEKPDENSVTLLSLAPWQITEVCFCLPDGGIDFWTANMSPYIISLFKKENYGNFEYDLRFWGLRSISFCIEKWSLLWGNLKDLGAILRNVSICLF